MDDKTKIAKYALEFMQELSAITPDKIKISVMEKRDLMSEAHLELKVVDGAMTTVGESKFLGTSYELRFEVWKEEE
jgi:hypothetical protein